MPTATRTGSKSSDLATAARYFHALADETRLRVLELLRSGEPARYKPISWAHFRDQRSAGDYADYGLEVQIAQYRINN